MKRNSGCGTNNDRVKEERIDLVGSRYVVLQRSATLGDEPSCMSSGDNFACSIGLHH